MIGTLDRAGITLEHLDDRWTASEAARSAGITYRQLDYWCRTGVICPAGTSDGHHGHRAACPGSGRRRSFTSRQVATLAACGQMARLCADTPALGALVDVIDCAPVELPVTVAVDADGVGHLVTDGQLVEQWGACWVVVVEPVD